jgi:hypothetical protein
LFTQVGHTKARLRESQQLQPRLIMGASCQPRRQLSCNPTRGGRAAAGCVGAAGRESELLDCVDAVAWGHGRSRTAFNT